MLTATGVEGGGSLTSAMRAPALRASATRSGTSASVGWGDVLGTLLVAAERAQQGAHLPQRRAGGRRDVVELRRGLLADAGEAIAGGRRLDLDEREPVGDDVVKLPRDALPLLGDEASLLLRVAECALVGQLVRDPSALVKQGSQGDGHGPGTEGHDAAGERAGAELRSVPSALTAMPGTRYATRPPRHPRRAQDVTISTTKPIIAVTDQGHGAPSGAGPARRTSSPAVKANAAIAGNLTATTSAAHGRSGTNSATST